MIVPVGIDSQDRVIYGHGRLLAAQAEGWTEIPTVTVEDLSEDQRRAFIHADNLLGETGYDKETLRSEAQALQAAGFDITLIGFDAAGIQLAENNYLQASNLLQTALARGDGEDAGRWLGAQDKLIRQILTLGEALGLTAEKRKAMGWTLPKI